MTGQKNSEPADGAWRPIETAPNNSDMREPEVITGAFHDGRFYQRMNRWLINCKDFGIILAGERRGEWSDVLPGVPPTYWQPLPAPPAESDAPQSEPQASAGNLPPAEPLNPSLNEALEALRPFVREVSADHDDGEPYRAYFSVKEIRRASEVYTRLTKGESET